MEDSFDPYRKWLAIAPDEQPPNHYRLLGVGLFEPDADVISNAADARMVHLKTFQGGRNTELSQKILNEVAAAKVCLLHPQRKADYDMQLRQRLTSQASAIPEPPPVPPPPQPPQQPPLQKPRGATPEPGIPSFESLSVSSYVSGRKTRRFVIRLLVMLVLVLLAALLVYLLSRGDEGLSIRLPGSSMSEPPAVVLRVPEAAVDVFRECFPFRRFLWASSTQACRPRPPASLELTLDGH